MSLYKTKANKLQGRTYKDINTQALTLYRQVVTKTKRKPYVRSKYFNKEKIFLETFWQHIWQKNWRDRKRRLKFFPCALELLRNTQIDPVSVQNPNNKSEVLHRFSGITPSKESFVVQVRENKKNNQKWLMSVYPD